MTLSRAEWRDLQREERRALCTTFEQVGPGAPTLCEGWTASSIAAHLVVSESLGGLPLGVSYPIRRMIGARATQATLRRMGGGIQRANERTERRGWTWLLERLRPGPPALYALPALALIRLPEAWVHHEDVRRAADPTPRPTTDQVDEALAESMAALTRMPELAVPRRGLRAVLPDGRSFQTSDDVRVTVTGPPGEVLLWMAGRRSVAAVTVDGADEDVEALAAGLTF